MLLSPSKYSTDSLSFPFTLSPSMPCKSLSQLRPNNSTERREIFLTHALFSSIIDAVYSSSPLLIAEISIFDWWWAEEIEEIFFPTYFFISHLVVVYLMADDFFKTCGLMNFIDCLQIARKYMKKIFFFLAPNISICFGSRKKKCCQQMSEKNIFFNTFSHFNLMEVLL